MKTWSSSTLGALLGAALLAASCAGESSGSADKQPPAQSDDDRTPTGSEVPDFPQGPAAGEPGTQAPTDDDETPAGTPEEPPPEEVPPEEVPPVEPADVTPPSLATRMPAPDAAGVPLDTAVQVVLDEPIACETLALDALELVGAATSLECVVNGDETLLRLTPDVPLVSAEAYVVVLHGAAVADLAGNVMAGDVTWSFTTEAAPPQPVVLLAAGDIASCSLSDDSKTADLLDGVAGEVLTLGDTSYPNGAASEFANCFGPTWGRHKARIHPAVGNHEYNTSGAGPYYDYFGPAAGPRGKGYYSFDAGAWHVVVLNSNCGTVPCDAGSAQAAWLRADLEASEHRCTLVYMHHPRFSSGNHGDPTAVQPLWQIMYENGVDLALAGHDHHYERLAPMTPTGTPDAATGIRSFVVGTGGIDLRSLPRTRQASEVRNTTAHGLLKLDLSAEGYAWEFLPVAGKSFADSGTGVCH